MAMKLRNRSIFLAVALLLARPGASQDASVPPPAPSSTTEGIHVHELLPDIGLIGAEVGLSGGVCANAFEAGQGFCGGGFIALPLRRAGSGRLSYEIAIEVGKSKGDPFMIMMPLAYVANLAAGASPDAAAIGPAAGAPFPVRREVQTELRTLQVSPFGFRYALGTGRGGRLRPYLAAGVDIVVVLSKQEPVRDEAPDVVGADIFDDPLIGGLAAQVPELAERGLPSGQGNLLLGAHAGAGLEIRTSDRFSVNGEYRFTLIESASGGTHAFKAALGFHW
jgi:opacity protein-like surface antigen